jgi:DNA-binding response OmpR family regulator
VILDLMLPGVDGLEICRRIRQMTRYLPVIIISARTSEMHRVLGLEMGADDYLAKPFSVLELIARVKALFRRQEAMGQNLLMDAGRLSCHGLSIDPLSREVKLRGEVVDLTPREFELLYYFARHPGEVFSVWRCWSRSGDISTKAMSIRSIPISTACAAKSNVTRPSRTSF